MVGYSRLMGENERETLAALRRHRRAIFSPKAEQYRGRIAKWTGDGALIEFASVVDSVRFAVDVQLLIRRDDENMQAAGGFRYRVGVDIGDIVVEDGDIYGDGVNVATRLQELAEPGGVCISATAYAQVRGKLDLSFDFLGEKRVKNIAEPVAAYAVRLDERAQALVAASASAGPATAVVDRPRRLPPARRRLVAGGVLFVLCLAALAAWIGYVRQERPSSPEVADVERYAYPLPDKPSIAVLPFINVGGEEERDHLAEGLTDDLITELSKVSGLFVIARHSVFALKDAAMRLPQIAAELGVRYILEGTLQRAGKRLRINVKLIDAMSGLSLWAERYDRQYADIFAIQDDVIGKIISALSVKLSEGERNQLARIPTDNLEAYDYYLRAEHEGFLYSDVDAYRRALSYYQRAIDLDPDFSDAHAGIARIAIEVLRFDYNLIWSAAVARKIAYDAAGRALAINPDNARAHTVLALLQLVDGRRMEAIASAERAVAVQPSDPEAFGNLALVLALTGSREEAVKQAETAMRLNPSPPPSLTLLAGVVLYTARRNDRAIPLLEAARNAMPNVEPAREYLAGAYLHRGDADAGRRELAHLLELFPEDNLTYYSYLYDYWREDDRRYHLSALHDAGLPEWPFGFHGREADRVGGAALRGIVTDRTWAGKHRNGTDFVQYFGRDGSTAYRSANTNLTGEFQVEDDRLCERFEGYFLDRMACGYVYRAANPAPGADYVSVTPQALKFFSTEPR